MSEFPSNKWTVRYFIITIIAGLIIGSAIVWLTWPKNPFH